jgi:hypothetical protein
MQGNDTTKYFRKQLDDCEGLSSGTAVSPLNCTRTGGVAWVRYHDRKLADMRQHVRSECLFATTRVNTESVADPEDPSLKEVTQHRYNVNRNRVHKSPSDRLLYYGRNKAF